MNRLKRFLFLKYAGWRTAPRVAAWRKRWNRRIFEVRARHGLWFERLLFRAAQGYWPNLQSPRSFNEHVYAKKLFDRNPLLPVLSDKYRARDFVRERLGSEAEAILIPQLYVTDDPDTIPFSALEGDYVIKANHGWAMNILHPAGEPLDEDMVRARLKLWLAQDYGMLLNEWAYLDIPRRVVIERMLQDSAGNIPPEVKFYCFGGVCELINLNYGYPDSPKANYFDRNLNRLDMRRSYQVGTGELPENVHDMIATAERLSAGFDFLRVDLYAVDGRVYFGELTNYPGSGLGKIRPEKMDFELGKLWSEKPA